ncbi:hypothetical protein ATO6_16015 [Oceanicola sp. 22II-s10i]|uniref:hypothetical protein n=1 Tax=Oceanicola sp. 22II-s10i TaxID=1317116 RepID=UPI000B521316|nr:hypothetical protein [Oceanicola sp. 22II-s10i]OWU83919.1 hypothetical protein ATO6_16015 [Oceanicola sp. 22II-s10i]
MSVGYSLKDQLFNPVKVAGLGRALASAWSGFDAAAFEDRVCARFPELELKARIAWIAEVLDEMLPGDFDRAAGIIETALPPPLDPSLRDDDFGQFIHAPYGDFAVRRGLEDHRDRALDLIVAVTQRFSMEYAIRHFLNRWPDETYARIEGWAGHPHYHVRRLASEGTRPKLPWGIGIVTPVERALPVLDRLHGDPTRFVTRSVANHLNDITKLAPDLALDRLQAWQGADQQHAKELDWMTGHALRGMVKAGDARALGMLGFDPEASVEVMLKIATPEVAIGEALEFSVTLSAPRALPVLVDWVLDFPEGTGRRGGKVFKLKQARLSAGHPLVMTKRHVMKGDATTFRLTPGVHRLSVQVNGTIRASGEFALR